MNVLLYNTLFNYRCPECRGLVVYDGNGALVCQECGLVVADRLPMFYTFQLYDQYYTWNRYRPLFNSREAKAIAKLKRNVKHKWTLQQLKHFIALRKHAVSRSVRILDVEPNFKEIHEDLRREAARILQEIVLKDPVLASRTKRGQWAAALCIASGGKLGKAALHRLTGISKSQANVIRKICCKRGYVQ